MEGVKVYTPTVSNDYTFLNNGEKKTLSVKYDDGFNSGFDLNYCIQVLQEYINVVSSIVNGVFNAIKKYTADARDIKDRENHVDEVIADVAKGDDKSRGKLPDDVVSYMRDNGILVNGLSIDEYIKNNGDTSGALNKGSLQAVKSALENSADRCMDMSSESQLTLQNNTQKRSNMIALVSSLINNNSDSCKSIIRNIG